MSESLKMTTIWLMLPLGKYPLLCWIAFAVIGNESNDCLLSLLEDLRSEYSNIEKNIFRSIIGAASFRLLGLKMYSIFGWGNFYLFTKGPRAKLMIKNVFSDNWRRDQKWDLAAIVLYLSFKMRVARFFKSHSIYYSASGCFSDFCVYRIKNFQNC